MARKMLIEAMHAEEERMVVLSDGILDEYDVETSTKKQIKGNIYLAKIIRIEPSLQAAFVEYGGNRHGFLAFCEISPDYYQIPVADKEKLQAEIKEQQALNNTDTMDDDEEIIRPRHSWIHKYKIQEVIHSGQIVLVQVVKEERGNKGAALTTYISLAGRYSVLMPNHGGHNGISRKVSGPEREEMKKMVDSLKIPENMSVIIRTAGKDKTKSQIKKDFDFLSKTWSAICEKTINSNAPCLIHEEGDLMTRSLRDVFEEDMEEVFIQGTEAFKNAKAFMKLLMPKQVKKLKEWKEKDSLFARYKVEEQLDAINSPIVHLPSGGYLVIDQTEALVAVDVNSGRATHEHSIEETALKTNLEAADELARQLRLRDLAGLIVVDFIDMEEAKNNLAVEKQMRDALRLDRSRVQVAKISQFGLMEISRQRMRSSLIETTFHTCPYCMGQGLIRSVESASMQAIHLLEEIASQNRENKVVLTLPKDVAFYVLNQKRSALSSIEGQFDVCIEIRADGTLQNRSDYRIEYQHKSGGAVVCAAYELPEKPENQKQGRGKQKRNSDRSNKKAISKKGQKDFKVVTSEPLVLFESHKNHQTKKNNKKKKEEIAPAPKVKKGGWWNRLTGEE